MATAIESLAIAVTTTETTLYTIDTANFVEIGVDVTNGGPSAFSAFKVYGKFHANATFQLLYSTAADYTAPTGYLQGTSGDLTAIANGGTGWFTMDVIPFYQVKVAAISASTSSVAFRALVK